MRPRDGNHSKQRVGVIAATPVLQFTVTLKYDYAGA